MVNFNYELVGNVGMVYSFENREIQGEYTENLEEGVYRETCDCHPRRKKYYAVVEDSQEAGRFLWIRLSRPVQGLVE